MTTAARPTFDPAKGKDSSNPTAQTHSRDNPSHTKLKYRKEGQEEYINLDEEDLKNQLLSAEREHLIKTGKIEEDKEYTHEQRALIEHFEKNEVTEKELNQNKEDGEVNDEEDEEEEEELEAEVAKRAAQVASNEEEEEEEDEDDDEEDTEALMRELEKIKKERAEARERKEREKAEAEKLKEEEILKGNPLLNISENQEFTVKRRWDDDVIFKNQARGEDDKPKKRFINDMLRSDFHRKFMDKYIR